MSDDNDLTYREFSFNLEDFPAILESNRSVLEMYTSGVREAIGNGVSTMEIIMTMAEEHSHEFAQLQMARDWESAQLTFMILLSTAIHDLAVSRGR